MSESVEERTVEDLLAERVDGEVESTVWYRSGGGTTYGMVTSLTDDGRAWLSTVLLDTEEETLRVLDNSIWLPADSEVLDAGVRSLARVTSASTGALDEDRDPMQDSLVDFDADEIGQYTLRDDYNPDKEDWKASEGADDMDVVHERLAESPVDNADRLIRLSLDGDKSPWDGEPSRIMRSPDEIGGNYGVEVSEEDDLVILDVDEIEDAPMDALPETLRSESPHDGEHRFLHVPGWRETFRERFDGTLNPHTSWGEIRASDGYVVGPGSELTQCKYGGCEECETKVCPHGCCTPEDPGEYRLDDGEIATMDAERLADLLAAGREGSA